MCHSCSARPLSCRHLIEKLTGTLLLQNAAKAARATSLFVHLMVKIIQSACSRTMYRQAVECVLKSSIIKQSYGGLIQRLVEALGFRFRV